PLVVAAEGQRATLRPREVGLAVDVPATVSAAQGQVGWGLSGMWEWFAGHADLDAEVSLDREALATSLAAFAERVDDPVVEGAVRFEGDQVSPRYPRNGLVLDRTAAADVVRRAFLRSTGSEQAVRLPMRVARPRIDREAVAQAMDRFAGPAVSEQLTLTLDGRRVRVDPREYTPALSLRPVGGRLRPSLDDTVLMRRLRPALARLERRPHDARITVAGARARVVPARPGVTVDRGRLASRFLGAVTRTGSKRVLVLRGTVTAPRFTTAQARALRVTERVSQFSTRFPHADYRNVNLGRAARLVDGTLLRPGETFSLNDTVGERTAANGFTKGFIISGGVFREDFGGGVSQVATTLFNAAFFAGLEDVEHKAHSFYISRYPVGREATVAWPSVDLRFRNTTPYGVLIKASLQPSTPSRQGVMSVSMWSTEHWDIKTTTSSRYAPTEPAVRRLGGPECVPNEGYAGFQVDVDRLFYRPGSSRLVRRETIHTTYTPSDTVICT
ncbi:MAG: VanW family protein, partial [Nocardioidaceae bacterium]